MKYLKKLGLVILAAAALAAFAGSASATTLTSPAGTTLGVGAKVKAISFSLKTDNGVSPISCKSSGFEGQVEIAGGAAETVRIPLTSLFFLQCSPDTFNIMKTGSLEIHTDTANADGNGVVTWNGGEITFQVHRSVLGFPITSHCIYYSENAYFGTLTGSKNKEGKPAEIDVSSAALPVKATDPICNEGGVTWTGNFTFETPAYLDVD